MGYVVHHNSERIMNKNAFSGSDKINVNTYNR